MEDTRKKSMSWGWIIFWLILFWPIGLFLLFRKQSIDKSATLTNTKTLFIVSYILIFLGICYAITTISGDLEATENMTNPITTGIVMMVLFGGGGVLLNRKARQMKTTGERYKQYITLVINQNQTSIDNIASAVGVSYATAVDDLQKMIDAGYFVGAYIYATQREIILDKTAAQQGTSVAANIQTQMKISTCKSCGANNKITAGQIAECEYCGSLLQ